MTGYYTFLHPDTQDPNRVLSADEEDALERLLREQGAIQGPLSEGDWWTARYEPGPALPQCFDVHPESSVQWTRCSVTGLGRSESQGRPAFHVTGASDASCPNCGEAAGGWSDALAAWAKAATDARWRCSECGQSFPPDRLNWNEWTGFASSWFAVEGLAAAARPQDSFLTLLSTITDSRWGWFYQRY